PLAHRRRGRRHRAEAPARRGAGEVGAGAAGGEDPDRAPQGTAEERGRDPGAGRLLRPDEPAKAGHRADEDARAAEEGDALAQRLAPLIVGHGQGRRGRTDAPGWSAGRGTLAPMRVRTGLDVWEQEQFRAVRGLRVGAIVNPTSVDGRFRHVADLLDSAPGVTLAALFGPEHGVRGEVQYMEAVDETRDPRTGVPMYSLYGSTVDSLRPRPEWLDGLDAVVFDIQDVGARYYTYVYTMALAMEACAKAGVRFVVLDRPNPLGGERVEGNLVEPGFRSFVGLYPLPNRHGMTVGE